MNEIDQSTKIAVFQKKEVRKTIHNNEWWFSVIDVVEALTGTERPRKYWNDLKKKIGKEGYPELSENIGQLKIIAPDGKMRETDCANTETIFRIIQSIPSPKAEPFKRWLAKVGYERVQEIEDPELATKRTRALYKAKGYTDAWIEKRMRGIEVRGVMASATIWFLACGRKMNLVSPEIQYNSRKKTLTSCESLGQADCITSRPWVVGEVVLGLLDRCCSRRCRHLGPFQCTPSHCSHIHRRWNRHAGLVRWPAQCYFVRSLLCSLLRRLMGLEPLSEQLRGTT
jgi:hypothetical protein